MHAWWMSHIDRLLLIYDGGTHRTMVIPFWHSFKRKTINTLLWLDEDGTAPISELKLFRLYQQSLRGLIKQDGERIVLIMRDMVQKLPPFVVNHRITKIKTRFFNYFGEEHVMDIDLLIWELSLTSFHWWRWWEVIVLDLLLIILFNNCCSMLVHHCT